MLNFQWTRCCLCLAIVLVASPASAVERVPGPPKISITPPKPPSVIRVNPLSVRPSKSPSMTTTTPPKSPSMSITMPPKSPSQTTAAPARSPSQVGRAVYPDGAKPVEVPSEMMRSPSQTTAAPAKSPWSTNTGQTSGVDRGETRDGPPPTIAAPAKSPSPPTTGPTSVVGRPVNPDAPTQPVEVPSNKPGRALPNSTPPTLPKLPFSVPRSAVAAEVEVPSPTLPKEPLGVRRSPVAAGESGTVMRGISGGGGGLEGAVAVTGGGGLSSMPVANAR